MNRWVAATLVSAAVGLPLTAALTPAGSHPVSAASAPSAPLLGGEIKIISDNDYALFAGDATNVTRVLYQNDHVFWDQVAFAASEHISLNDGETYIYMLGMGGGGGEDIGGTLNGVDVTSVASGVNGLQRAVGRPGGTVDGNGYLLIDPWLTDWNTASHWNCDSGGVNVCYGKYAAQLSDVQTALTGATWGDPPAVGGGQAGNAFGYGDSTAVMFRIKASALGTHSVSLNGTSATVNWLAPSSDGGSTILDYTVTAYRASDDSDAGRSCTTANGSTRTCTVSGLTGGVTYYFKVTARNSAGTGVGSDPTGRVTPAVPPATTTTTTTTTTSTTTTTVVPTTTTTVTTTTTSTTITSSSTTSTTSSSTPASTSSSPAPAVATTAAPTVSTVWASEETTTTTELASSLRGYAPAPNITTTSTTIPVAAGSKTTSAPVQAAPTTTLAPLEVAPDAPEVGDRGAATVIDGEEVEPTVTRDNNTITVSQGEMVMSVSAITPDGGAAALSPDGSLSLSRGMPVEMTVEDFDPQSKVSLWIFSSPSPLGSAVTDAAGGFTGRFPLPPGLKPGRHRVVLHGTAEGGKSVTFAVAATLVDPNANLKSSFNAALLVVPLVVAAFGALFLPAVLRRRRDEE